MFLVVEWSHLGTRYYRVEDTPSILAQLEYLTYIRGIVAYTITDLSALRLMQEGTIFHSISEGTCHQ